MCTTINRLGNLEGVLVRSHSHKNRTTKQLTTILQKSLFPAVISNSNANNSGSLSRFLTGASSKFSKHISRGSITLEAALAFPVVLTLFLSLFWILELFWIHTEIEASLYTIGNEIVACSYSFDELFDKSNVDEELWNEIKRIGFNEMAIGRTLRNSIAGQRTKYLNVLLSDVSKSNDIDIKVTYRVKPIISLPGFEGIWLSNHFYSKAYVGDFSEISQEEKEIIVYVTKNGEVYHTTLSCNSIKSQISQIPIKNISSFRSKDGSKYYPCAKCKGVEQGKVAYITPFGNRYHKKINCSELKVDVYAVKLSEVKGKRKCKLCP